VGVSGPLPTVIGSCQTLGGPQIMLPAYLEVSKLLDHALLAPGLDQSAVEAGLGLARTYCVASVCILPCYVPRARDALAGSGVKTSTTVGFPHGAQAPGIKLAEAERALRDGAEELDMVVNISHVLSGVWDAVRLEVRELLELCHGQGARLKLIFENCYLEDRHKIALCELGGELGVDWIKTSTGFGPSGATLRDLELMRRHAPAQVAIKAAGGIRDLSTLLAMRHLVTRIGTSHSQNILEAWRAELKLPPLELPLVSASGAY
jgi:deoxyribose-phosphate aldolase